MTRWSMLPSVWPKAETCIMGDDGLAVAHVIFAKHAPVIAAAPDVLDAAVRLMEAFELLQSPAAVRISAGQSDQVIRDAAKAAISDLRAAITAATGGE